MGPRDPRSRDNLVVAGPGIRRHGFPAFCMAARDEPGMIWVFGDPLVMGMLADKYERPQEAQTVS